MFLFYYICCMKSLKNKNVIKKVFSEGKKITKYPLVMSVLDIDTKGFLVTTSSKKFKRAVDRNLIKRYMREGLKGIEPTKAICIIYIGKEIPNKNLINQVKLLFN
jgi:ribonuclease P protein component